jgi:tetratricopeptide (TPR) repeat protein
MKKLFLYSAIALLLISCSNKPVVESKYVDSLLSNYSISAQAKTQEQDLSFWKSRYDSLPPDLVNKQKYAQALAARFYIYGDINDIRKADSIIQSLNQFYKESEPGPLLTLAGYNMTQHRFKEGKNYLKKAASLKAESYAVKLMSFDAEFELGNYLMAQSLLASTILPEDYGYNFRLAKYDHYAGALDSAIAHMMKAGELAKSPGLKQIALSNAADLLIHAGKINKAYELYKECIRLNSADFHSISGLGWIALTYDHNDSLAKKIFSFVQVKLRSPDPLWRLSQAYELSDSAMAKNYALQFIKQTSDSVYGTMYNKYSVDLYTGILHEPSKAVTISRKEIENRATPQTWAWLAWSLAANGQTTEAYNVYKENVSGKPLEGLELFWMGKMMKALNKGYNARQYFEAAYKNRYDLSPKQQHELDDYLK